jgi:amino acid transporter
LCSHVLWRSRIDGVYKQAEFVMVSIKLIAIVGLIILGIVISCGGGPNHESIGFRFWNDPGAFAQFNGIPGSKGQFLAFFSVFTQASFR